MEKWLCWGSMGVAGVLAILFVLDIAIQIPFGGLSIIVDVCGLISAGLLAYVGWDAYRDIR